MFLQLVREGQQWSKDDTRITILDIDTFRNDLILEMNGMIITMSYIDFCWQVHHLVRDSCVSNTPMSQVHQYRHGDILLDADGYRYMVIRNLKSVRTLGRKYTLYRLGQGSFNYSNFVRRSDVNLVKRISTSKWVNQSAKPANPNQPNQPNQVIDKIIKKGYRLDLVSINKNTITTFNPDTQEYADTSFGAIRCNSDLNIIPESKLKELEDIINEADHIMDDKVQHAIDSVSYYMLNIPRSDLESESES